MARDEFWKTLNWFKKDSKIDKWGDPSAIDELLLFKLEHLRTFLGVPIIVTSGVREKTGPGKSYHHKESGACAVDVVFPTYDKSAVDLIFDVSRFNFTGVGFYPHWRYNGEIVGGFHLDTRPTEMGARWMGVLDADGKQRYIDLTFVNLLKYAMDDISSLGDPWLN